MERGIRSSKVACGCSGGRGVRYLLAAGILVLGVDAASAACQSAPASTSPQLRDTAEIQSEQVRFEPGAMHHRQVVTRNTERETSATRTESFREDASPETIRKLTDAWMSRLPPGSKFISFHCSRANDTCTMKVRFPDGREESASQRFGSIVGAINSIFAERNERATVRSIDIVGGHGWADIERQVHVKVPVTEDIGYIEARMRFRHGPTRVTTHCANLQAEYDFQTRPVGQRLLQQSAAFKRLKKGLYESRLTSDLNELTEFLNDIRFTAAERNALAAHHIVTIVRSVPVRVHGDQVGKVEVKLVIRQVRRIEGRPG